MKARPSLLLFTAAIIAAFTQSASAAITVITDNRSASVSGLTRVTPNQTSYLSTASATGADFAGVLLEGTSIAVSSTGDWRIRAESSTFYNSSLSTSGFVAAANLSSWVGEPNFGVPVWAYGEAFADFVFDVTFSLSEAMSYTLDLSNSAFLRSFEFTDSSGAILSDASLLGGGGMFSGVLAAGDYTLKYHAGSETKVVQGLGSHSGNFSLAFAVSAAPSNPPTTVPDAGSTVALLAVGMIGLGAARRFAS